MQCKDWEQYEQIGLRVAMLLGLKVSDDRVQDADGCQFGASSLGKTIESIVTQVQNGCDSPFYLTFKGNK